jgi:hypothetical protein
LLLWQPVNFNEEKNMSCECLPEKYKIVNLYGGATNGIAAGTDYICCKNAHRVTFLIYTWGTTATTFVLSLREATDVAAGTTSAVTKVWPAWKVISTIATDALTKVATDAASLTIDPDGTDSTLLAVIQWDPSKHAAGYDCISVWGTTGNAADYCTITAIIEERYAQAIPPAAITD